MNPRAQQILEAANEIYQRSVVNGEETTHVEAASFVLGIDEEGAAELLDRLRDVALNRASHLLAQALENGMEIDEAVATSAATFSAMRVGIEVGVGAQSTLGDLALPLTQEHLLTGHVVDVAEEKGGMQQAALVGLVLEFQDGRKVRVAARAGFTPYLQVDEQS